MRAALSWNATDYQCSYLRFSNFSLINIYLVYAFGHFPESWNGYYFLKTICPVLSFLFGQSICWDFYFSNLVVLLPGPNRIFSDLFWHDRIFTIEIKCILIHIKYKIYFKIWISWIFIRNVHVCTHVFLKL